MERKQYKTAKQLSLQARLKLVLKLHMMGFSHFAIARELEYSIEQAKKDVATISHMTREWEDLGEHLKDTVARTGELLKTLKNQQDLLQKQCDYASEWVIQLDSFSQPIHVKLPNGENGELLYGPRDSRLALSLSGKITDLAEQQGKLLGVYAKTMDITVKLEESERTTLLVLEAIHEASPEIQSRIVRKLKALKANDDRFSNIEVEAIEGEYSDIEDSDTEDQGYLNA
jgi:hypothetical protein